MKFLKILPALLLLLILASCKKDKNILGTNVIPAEDLLSGVYSDTSKIYAHTVTHSVIASFNDRNKFLGSNQDPIFGRTDIGLYCNLNIINNVTNVSFGQAPQLILSELILKADNIQFIGDTLAALSYSVFTLDSTLSSSRVYKTDIGNKLANKNAVVGSYTGKLGVYQGKKVLRIPIDPNYAKSILNNTLVVTSNATFQSLYKGFYITSSGTSLNPNTKQGIICKYDLDDAVSGFYLRYQNGTPSATKELQEYRFAFGGGDAVKFNESKYQANLSSNVLLYNQLFNKDTIQSASQALFLKGFGGTRIKFKIPYLKNYTDSFPAFVHRAEVVFNVDPSFSTSAGTIQYALVPRLALMPLDSLGNTVLGMDQKNGVDFSRYDGEYDNDKKRYVFNIARHIQEIFKGKIKNYGFELVMTDPNSILYGRMDLFVERTVFAGTGTSLKPKFNLTYSPLKNLN